MYDGIESLIVSASAGVAPEGSPRATDRKVEVAAGGRRLYPDRKNQVLDSAPYGLGDRFGVASNDVRRAILQDPKAGSSFKTLKHSILADGITVLDPKPRPKKKADVVGAVRKAVAKLTGRAGEADPEDDELAKGIEYAAFCRRSLDRLPVALTDVVFEMLDAAGFGNRLSEVTYRGVNEGIDAGRLVFASIKVKPTWAYRYVLDPYANLLGVLVRVPTDATVLDAVGSRIPDPYAGRWMYVPREKFAILTWEGTNGDPVGHSVLDPIATWWEIKLECAPEWQKNMGLFATPSLVCEMPAGAAAQTPRQADVASGAVPSKSDIPAEEAYGRKLDSFANGTWMVIANGGKVYAIEAKGNGEVFVNCIKECDSQMISGILGQTRATQEAEHGSRADSQTGQDIMGLYGRYGRRLVARMIENDLLYQLMLLNFGLDAAERWTPSVSLGQTEHQDFPARAHAIAALAKAGLVFRSMIPSIMAYLGLEPPEHDDLTPIPMPETSGSASESDDGDPKGPQAPTPPGRKATRGWFRRKAA